MPTRRLLLSSFGLVVLGAFAIGWPMIVNAWFIFLVTLVLIGVVDLLAMQSPEKITVHRDLPARWAVGRVCRYGIVLTLRDARSLPVQLFDWWPHVFDGECKTQWFNLPAGGARQSLEFVCSRRGKFGLGPVHLAYASPLRLWHRRVRKDVDGEIIVVPRFVMAQEALVGGAEDSGMGLQSSALIDDGADFDTLRPYRSGDPIARIDWKATARSIKPVTKQFKVEREQSVLLALDTGRLMGAIFDGLPVLEWAIDSCLAMADMGLRQGDKLGLIAFDDRVHTVVPPRSAKTQMPILTEAISSVQLSDHDARFDRLLQHLAVRQTKRALIVVLTDFVDDASAAPMLKSLTVMARRHACLFVALEDYAARDVLADSTQTMSALYAKAIAYDINESRHAVLRTLSRIGVSTISALPNAVTPRLLNQYRQVRRSAAA